jgi:hypothetical protein
MSFAVKIAAPTEARTAAREEWLAAPAEVGWMQ